MSSVTANDVPTPDRHSRRSSVLASDASDHKPRGGLGSNPTPASQRDVYSKSPSTSHPQPMAHPQRHHEFYFKDGNVVMQVEHTIYRLHRSLLEKHSRFFHHLFMLPQPEGSTEGLSDSNPIILASLVAEDFDCLLRLLYPPVLGTCKLSTAEEWISIFEQADRWQMDILRDRALEELRGLYMDPICKLAFWRRFDLDPNELVPTYRELILRQQPLSLREGEIIGLEMCVLLAHARDIAYAEGIKPAYRGGNSARIDRMVGDLIQRIFNLPSPSPPSSML